MKKVIYYLCFHVLKRSWANDGKANQENVRLRVGERAKTIVIFLTSCIPKSKIDDFAIDHHVCGVVVKDSWNVLAREGICCVADEQASFTHSTITNNNTFDCLHGFFRRGTFSKKRKGEGKRTTPEEGRGEKWRGERLKKKKGLDFLHFQPV